jgi:hypothetical protein
MAINDGSANAPVGSPQLPNLLSGEAVRPSWQVAGVDYAVGNPSNVTMKDPSTISMSGVSVDAAHHMITVTGNNVTLDGYDFSLGGGWGVSTQAANTSILNSKFVVGSNGNAPIHGTATASNLQVGYTSIEGKGVDLGIGLIEMKGSGLTVHYSAVMNSGGDLIQAHGSGIIDLQHNLIEQGGIASGAHGDFLETIGGPFSATILYNTTVQHSGGLGGTQGLMLEPDFHEFPGVITSAEYAHNTFVATGGNQNYFLGVTVADIVNTVTVHDNYFDATGTFGFVPGGIRSGPDDGSNKTIFTNNVNMKNGSVIQDSNAPPPPPVVPPPATPPTAAPKIASFSPDTGAVGDGITDHNVLTLTGTASANSTVKIFDGSAQIGSTTTNASGSWDYITSVLTDAKHMLTAKATDASGQTSAASSVLAVTVDTHAPAAPALVSGSVVNTNHVLLSGTAEANSTITAFDGTTAVGTATASSNGAWSLTTGALATGSQVLTATATDAAGNISAHSQALDPVIGSPPPSGPPAGSPPPSPQPPSAPKIVSFSQDSGVVGDHITNDNTLTLSGTAAANSTVAVFDGTTKLGTATANGSGAWNYTTAALSDGKHSLMAQDTDSSGHTSSASSPLAVTIDTHAPAAPTMAVFSQGRTAVAGATTADDFLLKGTTEANSTVHVFDGAQQVGTVTTNGSGHWSFDTGHLADGSHSFTSTATDVAGNASAASAAKGVTVDAPAPASTVGITHLHENARHIVTIKGTADASHEIKIYDGTNVVATEQAGANGVWSFKSSSAVSNTVHTFTAREFDSTGHVVASSGSAIVGSTGGDTLRSTTGNDVLAGHGQSDTFVFASNFGKDVINDFRASGPRHDVVQFSKSVFDNFADVLAHATQSGHNVVIADTAGDSLTLKNVKLGALDKHDFHFA